MVDCGLRGSVTMGCLLLQLCGLVILASTTAAALVFDMHGLTRSPSKRNVLVPYDFHGISTNLRLHSWDATARRRIHVRTCLHSILNIYWIVHCWVLARRQHHEQLRHYIILLYRVCVVFLPFKTSMKAVYAAFFCQLSFQRRASPSPENVPGTQL